MPAFSREIELENETENAAVYPHASAAELVHSASSDLPSPDGMSVLVKGEWLWATWNADSIREEVPLQCRKSQQASGRKVAYVLDKDILVHKWPPFVECALSGSCSLCVPAACFVFSA